MSTPHIGRRELFRQLVVLSGAIATGSVLAGCGEDKPAQLTCTNTSGLSPADLQIRQSLEYVDATPMPDKTCVGCKFYTAAQAATQCGSCQLVKGPIHPNGYCKSWIVKA